MQSRPRKDKQVWVGTVAPRVRSVIAGLLYIQETLSPCELNVSLTDSPMSLIRQALLFIFLLPVPSSL